MHFTVIAANCNKASIQTFGDFLGFNPHLHILAADGCFKDIGMFYASPADIDADSFEPLFRHKILSMLKKRGLITDRVIKLILSWHHTGFNVYCTDRIYPGCTQSMENLARYIIRASFSQERMSYIREKSMVIMVDYSVVSMFYTYEIQKQTLINQNIVLSKIIFF